MVCLGNMCMDTLHKGNNDVIIIIIIIIIIVQHTKARLGESFKTKWESTVMNEQYVRSLVIYIYIYIYIVLIFLQL